MPHIIDDAEWYQIKEACERIAGKASAMTYTRADDEDCNLIIEQVCSINEAMDNTRCIGS